MKQIPRIDLPADEVLTPLEMNAIHFDTGSHSTLTSDTPKSDPVHRS